MIIGGTVATGVLTFNGIINVLTTATFLIPIAFLYKLFTNKKIGGTGEGEMFHGADEIGRLLSKNTAESCASYNMLKLTKELFSYQPDSRYMDYYERTMFNHIASSCDHAPTGASTYFMPLAPGFRKEFDDENSCCHGTGLENHFKYAESIYFQNDKAVYVNLFVPSALEKEDFKIIQEEREDAPGEVTLKVQGSRAVTLKVRVPYWCQGSYQIWINGAEQSVETSSDGYLTLNADWSKETTVEIHFTCHYTLERTPDVRDIASLLYGPYVLAALTEEKDYLHLPRRLPGLCQNSRQICEDGRKNEIKNTTLPVGTVSYFETKMSIKAGKKIKRSFLSEKESCIIVITVRGYSTP